MRKAPTLDLVIAIVILCIGLTLAAVAAFADPCHLPHPASPTMTCDGSQKFTPAEE